MANTTKTDRGRIKITRGVGRGGTASAWTSRAGMRTGKGDCQGVQTVAQKTTNYQKTPRYGEAQERVKRKHDGGGQEARNWRHNPPQDR